MKNDLRETLAMLEHQQWACRGVSISVRDAWRAYRDGHGTGHELEQAIARLRSFAESPTDETAAWEHASDDVAYTDFLKDGETDKPQASK